MSNSFDVGLELFLNRFVYRSHLFDQMMSAAASSYLLRGGLIVVIVWYALFDKRAGGRLRKRSELLMGAILISAFATLAARGLALTLPFRTRPVASPDLHFQVAFRSEVLDLFGWSSFPSDHAVLFFPLSTGVFFVSRRLGWLATALVSVVICFPRLYLGIHWPTDILAGAALGVGFAHIAKIRAIRAFIAQFTAKWYREQPGFFFAALFFWSYEIVTLFEDGRHFASFLLHLPRH
jgi:undecaprenyl-diphosphatase